MGDVLAGDQQLVFVGGLHRSGTTLLARLLASHPDATGLSGTGVPEDEGQHIQDVYAPAERHGGTGRFALKAKAHLTEASPLATPESAQRLWEAWRPYWDSDQRFLIEKYALDSGRAIPDLADVIDVTALEDVSPTDEPADESEA